LDFSIIYVCLQLSFGSYQSDEQAWIDTIKSVGTRETVRINTMDWLGQSQFTDQTIFWSSLSSAISEVTKQFRI
jgi:phospholipase D3/4